MPEVSAASIGHGPERMLAGSSGARAADGSKRYDEAIGVFAGAGFASLLEVTREHLGRTVRGTAFENTSAEQMFEPPVADAHERRQTAMKEEFRAASVDAANDRYATRAEAKSKNPSTDGASPGEDGSRRGALRRVPVQEPAGPLQRASKRTEADSGVGRAATPPVRKETVGDHDAGRRRGRLPTGRPGSEMTSAGQAVRTGSSVPVSFVGGGQQGGGPRDGGVAQQVARVLGVHRSVGAESVRPVEASTGSSQAGGEWTASKPRSAALGSSAGRGSETGEAERAKANEPSRFAELIRSIRTQSGTKQSTARIQLEPPELGRMRVNVSLRDDRLHVEVRTETAEASRLVTARAAELKAALASQGLQVEQFEVSYDSTDVSGFRAGDGAFASADRRGFVTEPQEGDGVVQGFAEERELWDFWGADEVTLAFGQRLLDVKA